MTSTGERVADSVEWWVDKLSHAAAAGNILDVESRDLPVDALRQVLVDPHLTTDPGGLRIQNAYIADELDLEYIVFHHPLHLIGCKIGAPIKLAGAAIKELDFTGSRVKEVNLDCAQIAFGVEASEGFTAEKIQALGARIGGQLNLNGATLHNTNGPALALDGAEIAYGVFANGSFSAHGEVRALGARIGGQLNLNGATLHNTNGPALAIDRAEINGNMFATGYTAGKETNYFAAEGEIRASGARIRGQLDLGHATLNNPDGAALDLEGAEITGDVFANEGFTANGEIRASGARIGGQLSFRKATLRKPEGNALILDRAVVEDDVIANDGFTANGQVRALGARVGGRLDLCGATLTDAKRVALNLDGAKLENDVVASDQFRAEGGLSGIGAKIAGTLSLNGARITSTFGNALNADRIEVGGDASFSDGLLAQTNGPDQCAISLFGAKIGGKLSFEGSHLYAKNGRALCGNQMTVAGTAAFNEIDASGGVASVELGSAKIEKHLIFDGAHLVTRAGIALAADRIEVGGQATFVSGFLAQTSADLPAVTLGGAKIGGQLDLTGARLNNKCGPTLFADSIAVAADAMLDDLQTNRGAPAVRLRGAQIGGKLDCRAFDVEGCVSQLDLMNAAVGTLRLNAAYGGKDCRWLVLDGLTYRGIPSDDMSVDEWIDTLKDRTPAYRAQPWYQLGMAHNAIGHDDAARRILIEQRVDYRRRVLIPDQGERMWAWSGVILGCRRAWSWVLQVFTGYGYRSYRAFFGLLGVVVISVSLTLGAGYVPVPSPPPAGPYVAQLNVPSPPSAGPYVAQLNVPNPHSAGARCSASEQIGLGLQIGLPLVKVPAGDRCRLDTTSGLGQLFTFISWGLQALAWVFATLAVAGYTGLIRKL
jgi:hypothetical protein